MAPTNFSARFRSRLLRAAGLSAIVAPTLLAACADKVTVFGPGEDDDATSTSSGGASGPTSSSSGGDGGHGGSPTTVVTVTNTTGVTTGGGAPPTQVLCWEIDGPCPSLQAAPNALGPCGPDFNYWIDSWIDGPFSGPNGACCYEVEAYAGCGVGRPYLEHDAPVVASLVASPDWPGALGEAPSELSDNLRAALAEAWAHDAAHEHASVASFARVALELMALGAPPELIAAAHRAARDEVEHARLCYALASRFRGEAVGPGPLPLGDSVPLTTSLAAMAAATVAEGCIGETLAVAVARAQLEVATDPEVRAALATIVEDESRHAELAWSTVAWAIRTGGDEVRRAVEEAFAHAEHRRLEVVTTAAPALSAYGRLSAEAAEAVQRQTLAEVILPCASSLLREQPRRARIAPAARA